MEKSFEKEECEHKYHMCIKIKLKGQEESIEALRLRTNYELNHETYIERAEEIIKEQIGDNCESVTILSWQELTNFGLTMVASNLKIELAENQR